MQRSVRHLLNRLEQSRLASAAARGIAPPATAAPAIATGPKRSAPWQRVIAGVVAFTLWAGPLQMVWQDAANSAARLGPDREQRIAQHEAIDWQFFAMQLKQAVRLGQRQGRWTPVYALLESRLPGLVRHLSQQAGVRMPSLQFGTAAEAAPIADPAAPIRFQPQITQSTGAGGGVPVVNITAPNAAGISLNQYSQFNVDAIGLILNNSLIGGGSVLGGTVAGNAALGGHAATQIVNQVTAQGSPSAINGAIEVFGSKADVIIANPNGINCTACSFMNTPRVIMSTGTPQFLSARGGSASSFDNAGALAYDVRGGHIQIEGLAGAGGTPGSGIENSTGTVDLIGGSIGVNAAINGGRQINLISGQQTVSEAITGQGKAGSDYNVAANGSAPNFSGPNPAVQIDATAFGAMNAGQIKIIGTTAGLGVHADGNLNANNGVLSIDVNGDLTVGNGYGSQGIDVRASGGIAATQLTSYGDAAANAGSDLLIGQLTAAGNAQISGRNVAMGATLVGGDLSVGAAGNLLTSQSGAIKGNAILTIAGAMGNSGDWTAGNDLTVNAAALQNALSAKLIGLGTTTITTADMVNNGTVYGDTMRLNAANSLSNNFGSLQAKSALNVQTNALTGNLGGMLYAGDPNAAAGALPSGDVTLIVNGGNGSFNNVGGTVAAGRDLTFNALNQSFDPGSAGSGTLNLGGTFSLNVRSFNNSGAWSVPGSALAISAANGIGNSGVMQTLGDISLASSGGVIANSGAIVAGQDLNATGTLRNAAGAILHAQRDVNLTGAATNGGTVEALRDVNLLGASYDNSNGVTKANRTISANLSGALTNVAGTIAAGQDVQLNAGSVDNDRAAPVTLVSSSQQVQNFDLAAGTYIGNYDLTVVDNSGEHNVVYQSSVAASISTLFGSAPTLDRVNGVFTAYVPQVCSLENSCYPAYSVTAALPTVYRTVLQQTQGAAGQILAGRDAFVTAASLSNRGSAISAGNNLVASLSSLDNGSSGTVITNRSGDTVNQASLDAFMQAEGGIIPTLIGNTLGGMVSTAAPASVAAPSTVTETSVLGARGQLRAGGNVTLNGTGNLVNAGDLIAGNNIAITLPGSFVNQGTYASSFTSTPGCLPGVRCQDANAHVDTFAYQQTPNSIVAGGTLTVTAASIANDFGALTARGDVNLSAHSIDNLAGTIQSTAGDINLAAASVINRVVSPVSTHEDFGSKNPDFAQGCNAGGNYKGSNCSADVEHAASSAAVISGARDVNIDGSTLSNTGGLISAGRNADINISDVVSNNSVALNTTWQGHWIEETCWTCSDVDHYTYGVVANGNQAAGIQAGNALTLKADSELINTGNLSGADVNLSGASLLNGIMDAWQPTAPSTAAQQAIPLGPTGTADAAGGAPSAQAPLYAVSVPGSGVLSTIGPDLLVANLPAALRPETNLFYYDAASENDQIRQAALTQTGAGTFINGVTWDATNHLSIDDQQKAILYDNAIAYAAKNNLQLGQPLSTAQIGALDKPMLWYVQQSVPDPSCSFSSTLCGNINALMPQIYLPQGYAGKTAGGVIAGGNVNLSFADSITNTGIVQATNLVASTDTLVNRQRSADIGKQDYQVQGGWMEYSGTQLQPGGFMSAVNLDVQAQHINAIGDAFQVLKPDGTPDTAGTAALLGKLKQQLGGDFTQSAAQDNIQNHFIQDTSGPGMLGQVIAIAVAIALSVVTGGAGLGLVSIVTGSEVAAGSVAAVIAAGLQAAIVGTLSSITTQLITTGNVDFGQALKSGAVSGVIGGVTAGVMGNAPGSSTTGGVADSANSATTVTPGVNGAPPVSQGSWSDFASNPTQFAANAAIRSGISAAINSAVYGGSFGNAFVGGVVSDAAAVGANGIGGATDAYTPANVLSHALLGCAAASLSGNDCAGGAIGGAASSLVAPLLVSWAQGDDIAAQYNGLTKGQTAAIAALSILAGGALAAALGQNATAAANAAANEVLNNTIAHSTFLSKLRTQCGSSTEGSCGLLSKFDHTQASVDGMPTKGPWQIVAQLDGNGVTVAYSAYNTVSKSVDYVMDPQDLNGFMKSDAATLLGASGFRYLANTTPQYQQQSVNGATNIAAGIVNLDGSQIKQGLSDFGMGWIGALKDPAWWLQMGTTVAGGFVGFADKIAGRGASSVIYGPLAPGPLTADVVNTFRSGTYAANTLSTDTTLYRVIPEGGNPTGSYWTSVKPQGPLQSVIDSALDQNWGNTATQVVKANIPAGTTIYEGAAAAQRGLVGGGNQIYIPQVNPSWIIH